jgi:hypothetical protein
MDGPIRGDGATDERRDPGAEDERRPVTRFENRDGTGMPKIMMK